MAINKPMSYLIVFVYQKVTHERKFQKGFITVRNIDNGISPVKQ